jgi:hypothetical protein
MDTETTYSDYYGTYGHGGATLADILTELDDQWFQQWSDNGVSPGVVIGHSLFENSISQGETYSTIVSQLTSWLSAVAAEWPLAKIILCTPRPSTYYDSDAAVLVYQQVRDYVLSLDDGINIFCNQSDAYEDPENPGTPLDGYTDNVHPNVTGAMLLARDLSVTIRRLGLPENPNALTVDDVYSENRYLTGSASAAGTDTTGIKPTGTAIVNGSGTSVISDVVDDGWQLTWAAPADGEFYFTSPIFSIAEPSRYSFFTKIEIVSGAEFIKLVTHHPRFRSASSNTYQYFLYLRGSDTDLVYQDGDILYLYAPPKTETIDGVITSQGYFNLYSCAAGDIVIKILEQGIALVDEKEWSSVDSAGTALTYTLQNAVAATNELLNSGVPVTQTTSDLAVGDYILWVDDDATGSVALTVGTAVVDATGSASASTPLTFSVTTAGTVTVTVTDTVSRFQLEAGSLQTPFIYTDDATATRDADNNYTGVPNVWSIESGAARITYTPSEIVDSAKIAVCGDVDISISGTSLVFGGATYAAGLVADTTYNIVFYWTEDTLAVGVDGVMATATGAITALGDSLFIGGNDGANVAPGEFALPITVYRSASAAGLA